MSRFVPAGAEDDDDFDDDYDYNYQNSRLEQKKSVELPPKVELEEKATSHTNASNGEVIKSDLWGDWGTENHQLGEEEQNGSKNLYDTHMDIFLKGLELSEYYSLFEENSVKFLDLLELNDEDLIKIGIDKLVHRKKILTALKSTHQQKWENDSLLDLSSNDYISCPEMISMVENIGLHLAYIEKSINFLQQKIGQNSQNLGYSKDVADVGILFEVTKQAQENSQNLTNKLFKFKRILEKVKDDPRLLPTDRILSAKPFQENEQKDKNLKIQKFVSFSIITITCFFMFKHRLFLSKIWKFN